MASRVKRSVSDQLAGLLEGLAGDSTRSTVLSVRMQPEMHEAMRLVVDAGLASSVNDAFVRGNMVFLRSCLRELAVVEYRKANPDVQRSLPRVARARAIVEGYDELAERMDLLEAAAAELLQFDPDPDPHDVVVFAFAEYRRERRPNPRRKAG